MTGLIKAPFFGELVYKMVWFGYFFPLFSDLDDFENRYPFTLLQAKLMQVGNE